MAPGGWRGRVGEGWDRDPEARVGGVPATPKRGEKQGMRPVYTDAAERCTMGELIGSGHLVPPRTFVIDVGAQEALKNVRKTVDDFDMKAVDAIMNTAPITEAVIRHWREKAGERQTVVFCSTVDHARNVGDAFAADGVDADMKIGRAHV